ncbi:nuclease-related domain-containing protein [Streptomyces qinglanensis]|uniref:nuclease-related domain-containing protein n=1 Tax=Streptomyces qinglanensis TaxID=943816 RepID=UPI003D745524
MPSFLILLLTAGALFWAYARGWPRARAALTRWAPWLFPGRDRAGASADARARQLRTPLVRLAEATGVRTRAGQLATRYAIGAEGERRTATRIDPLRRKGFTVMHDRALPTSRANVDHLVIAPGGAVFLPDTKKWSARYPVTVRAGRLWHGDRDVTGRLRGLHHEAETVAAVLGVPVTPIVAMEGAPLLGPQGRPTRELVFRGVRIVPSDVLPNFIRTTARIPGPRPAADLVARAEHALPPYTRS